MAGTMRACSAGNSSSQMVAYSATRTVTSRSGDREADREGELIPEGAMIQGGHVLLLFLFLIALCCEPEPNERNPELHIRTIAELSPACNSATGA